VRNRGWTGWYFWNSAYKIWNSLDRRPSVGGLWPVSITEHEVSPWEKIVTVQVDAEEGFHSVWGSTEAEGIEAFRKVFLDDWMQADVLRKNDTFYLRLSGPIAARARIKIQAGDFRLECDRPFADVKAAERFVKQVIGKREIKKLQPEIWHEVVTI
jgi:hypothetical protein